MAPGMAMGRGGPPPQMGAPPAPPMRGPPPGMMRGKLYLLCSTQNQSCIFVVAAAQDLCEIQSPFNSI